MERLAAEMVAREEAATALAIGVTPTMDGIIAEASVVALAPTSRAAVRPAAMARL